MVAYSFKRRFVIPIQVGLGQVEHIPGTEYEPKTQTIRANGKKRHARPDELVQLYYGLRTKQCFSIGVARCTEAKPIFIEIEAGKIIVAEKRVSDRDRDAFSRADGFRDFKDFALFWYETNHVTMNDFHGTLIKWAPL